MTEREAHFKKAMAEIFTVMLDGAPVLVLPEVARAMGLKRGMAIDWATFRAIAHQLRARAVEAVRQEELGVN